MDGTNVSPKTCRSQSADSWNSNCDFAQTPTVKLLKQRSTNIDPLKALTDNSYKNGYV